MRKKSLQRQQRKKRILREWRRFCVEERGSYTVEATCIMGVLLLLIVTILNLGFYWHAKICIPAECYVQALRISWDARFKTGDWESRLKKQSIGMREVQTAEETDKDRVRVLAEAKIRIPFPGQRFRVCGESEVGTESPAASIRKVRQIQQALEEVLCTGED